jgi:hypothetical protein
MPRVARHETYRRGEAVGDAKDRVTAVNFPVV